MYDNRYVHQNPVAYYSAGYSRFASRWRQSSWVSHLNHSFNWFIIHEQSNWGVLLNSYLCILISFPCFLY